MMNRKAKTVSRNKETGEFTRYSTADFEFVMQGVLIASYRLASLSALGMAPLQALEDGERGCIILTSSAAAEDAQIGQVGYGAGKAGVNGLLLPMARDLMDLGIRVNAIMPGLFGTPLLNKLPQKVFDSLSASVPFPKRLGKPEEYASLAMEIVRNTYFNAQSIRLDGAIRMPPR
jgi:NAD(P)-dependent dehydrogenase (short-subunit alcohol dehydrogenase family)